MTKHELREFISNAIAGLSAEERLVADAHIASQIVSLPSWSTAGTVFAYLPIADEVDISPLLSSALRSGTGIALPRISGGEPMTFALVSGTSRTSWSDVVRDLERHPYGLLQPSSDAPAVTPVAGDVVLVPGRAFDRSGNRLGRGGGYYDAFLSGLPDGVGTIAPVYALQVRQDVPVEEGDVPVGVVVSDAETVFCKR